MVRPKLNRLVTHQLMGAHLVYETGVLENSSPKRDVVNALTRSHVAVNKVPQPLLIIDEQVSPIPLDEKSAEVLHCIAPEGQGRHVSVARDGVRIKFSTENWAKFFWLC